MRRDACTGPYATERAPPTWTLRLLSRPKTASLRYMDAVGFLLWYLFSCRACFTDVPASLPYLGKLGYGTLVYR